MIDFNKNQLNVILAQLRTGEDILIREAMGKLEGVSTSVPVKLNELAAGLRLNGKCSLHVSPKYFTWKICNLTPFPKRLDGTLHQSYLQRENLSSGRTSTWFCNCVVTHWNWNLKSPHNLILLGLLVFVNVNLLMRIDLTVLTWCKLLMASAHLSHKVLGLSFSLSCFLCTENPKTQMNNNKLFIRFVNKHESLATVIKMLTYLFAIHNIYTNFIMWIIVVNTV